MAHDDAVQWVCDTCTRTVALPKGTTPEGWQQMKAQSIDPKETKQRVWEICAGCYSKVERLLMNHKNVDPA